MPPQSIFDRLIHNHWELAIAAALVLIAVGIGARKFGTERAVTRFPLVAAITAVVVAPMLVIIVGSLVRIAAGYTGIGLDEDLRRLTVFLAYVVAALALARVVDVFLLVRSDARRRLPRIMRGLFYAACALVGILAYLKVHGYEITGFWVSTGVVAALVGFALQKTLGDLFSGVALSLERPFRIGDWLELADGSIGQVTDVNWRATRLRGWDNATHVIPNSELAGQSFKNMHALAHPHAPWYLIKLPAEVDPRFAKALLLEAALRTKRVLKQPYPIVRIADATTIPYTYMIWVHFSDYPSMFAGREELFREIHYLLKSSGIHISADIKELHTRKSVVSTAEPPNVLLALKGLDVAAALAEDELQKIAAASRYFYADAGTVLLGEGDVATSFDVILSGIANSSIVLTDGSERMVQELGPGQYFGIVSMTTHEPSHVQVAAQTDVTLIRVDIDCIREIVAANPRHAEGIAKIVKQRMDAAEQVRAASRRPAQRLGLDEILHRVESYLLGDRRP